MAYGVKPMQAVVIRAKTDKTVIVQYNTWRMNNKYNQPIKSITRIMVHDPNNICHVGDRVLIAKSRKYSLRKSWEIREILHKDAGVAFLAQNPEFYVDPEDLKVNQQEIHRQKSPQFEKKLTKSKHENIILKGLADTSLIKSIQSSRSAQLSVAKQRLEQIRNIVSVLDKTKKEAAKRKEEAENKQNENQNIVNAAE